MCTSDKVLQAQAQSQGQVQGQTQSQAAETPTQAQAQAQARGAASRAYLKAACRYAAVSAACALFAFIYAQFAHGVYSPFMTFMFAIPLLGGALVVFALHLVKAPQAPRMARQAWALAIASLTLGSCLQGIFEIAGTSSALIVAYPAAAVVFAIAAVVLFARPKAPRRAHASLSS